MTPERIVLATFLVLGLSVSARAETIQITIDKLVFAPVEVNAKVGDTIGVDQQGCARTHRDGYEWRLECEYRAKTDRAAGAEQAELNRLLLQVSSQYEGPRDRRAVRCC